MTEGAAIHFNVSQLLKETSGSRRNFGVDEKLALTDDKRLRRVLGTVNLLRTDKGIWASASLDSEVLCGCSRCLNQYEQPISMTIEEEFFPLVDGDTGARLEIAGNGKEVSFVDRDNILDLAEVVRQYAALDVPMKPVCSKDCAGICASCGANLNEIECDCDKRPIDSRWGVLIEHIGTNEREG